jgi:hypothetical protein
LNEQFKDVQDDLKKLEELNKQLESPKELPSTEEQQKEVTESQEKSSQDLKGGKKSNASKNQKNAAKKMEEMAEKMEAAMEQEEEEQQEEDAAALRQLLENLVSLSFSQEKLMNDFSKLNIVDPNYDSYGQRQRKINDDMKMVEDSLFALSKRVSQLSTFINKEVGDIQNHMGAALKWIPERQIPATRAEQQFVMTGLNNLALMLDEALQQMQEARSKSRRQEQVQAQCWSDEKNARVIVQAIGRSQEKGTEQRAEQDRQQSSIEQRIGWCCCQASRVEKNDGGQSRRAQSRRKWEGE